MKGRKNSAGHYGILSFSPYLLWLITLVLMPVRIADAADCGSKPGWPVLPNVGPIVSYTVSAPRPVNDAGWAGAQSLALAANGGQARTTNDMATCIPVQVGLEYLGKTADSAVRPSLGTWTPVAGNNAHYDATVEEFVDCAETVPGSGQAAGGPAVQHNCSAQGTGPHGEPVTNGPDGHIGYWQDIGTHQAADLQNSNANSAGSYLDSTVLLVPAELLDVSAWLRVHARYWEGDSRIAAGPMSWPQGSGPAYCPPDSTMVNVYKHGHSQQQCKSKNKVHDKHGGHYVYTGTSRTVHQSAGSFQADAASPAFKMSVNPAALVQLKAVPYAIAYMPPGNQGKTRLIEAITEGTNYAIGTTHGASNSSGDVKGTCESTSFGFAESIFGTGFGFSSSDLECQSITSVSGTTQGSSVVDAAYQNQSNDSGTEVTDPGYAPGDYAKEAFWFDTFTIALNQPAAVYDDNGTSVTRFLPVRGYPDWGQMPLIQLAACAYGRTIPGVADVCKAGYTPDSQKVDLTPDEAFSILWLDPFFPMGQSIVPDTSAGRFASLNNLGAAGTINCPAGTTCILQASNAQGLSGTSGFQAGAYTSVTVSNTNKDTQGWSLTLGVKYLGVAFGDTFGGATSNIQGTVNSNGASLGYFTSTAVSTGQTLTFRVSPSDKTHDIVATTAVASTSCTSYPNPITVYPYQDSVFGGILLRDPCAPMPSWWRPKGIHPLPERLPQAIRPPIPGIRIAPAAAPAELASQFTADLDLAISSNPHLAEYINRLPLRCSTPACLNIRRKPVPIDGIRVLPRNIQ